MNLLFDFKVDKAAMTIYITREFAADLDLVWDAFTKAEILDQWQGPKPLRAVTKEMDFREGGRWLYSMVNAENVTLGFSLVQFLEIRPKTSFSTKNSFSDANGTLPEGNKYSVVKNTFKEGKEITTLYVEKKFFDLAVLEMMSTNGFKEGSAAAFENLDEYLLTSVTVK